MIAVVNSKIKYCLRLCGVVISDSCLPSKLLIIISPFQFSSPSQYTTIPILTTINFFFAILTLILVPTLAAKTHIVSLLSETELPEAPFQYFTLSHYASIFQIIQAWATPHQKKLIHQFSINHMAPADTAWLKPLTTQILKQKEKLKIDIEATCSQWLGNHSFIIFTFYIDHVPNKEKLNISILFQGNF